MALELGKWAPPPVPTWRAVGIILAVSWPVFVPLFFLLGPGAVITASGGFALGAFALTSTTLRKALPLSVVGAVAVLVFWAVLPSPPGALLVTALLSILAGIEMARTGTRILVMAIFAVLAMQVGVLMEGGIWLAPAFLAGLGAGLLAVWLAGLAGIMPAVKESPRVATAMGVFLIVGLTISVGLALLFDHPRSYWIAFMFTFRVVVPVPLLRGQAIRFGKGASIGVLLAVLIGLLHLPVWANILLAGGIGLIGMRYLTHPLPVSAGAISTAILLATGATLQDAVFRIEAALITVALILFLAFALDRLWRTLLDRPEKGTSPL